MHPAVTTHADRLGFLGMVRTLLMGKIRSHWAPWAEEVSQKTTTPKKVVSKKNEGRHNVKGLQTTRLSQDPMRTNGRDAIRTDVFARVEDPFLSKTPFFFGVFLDHPI